MKPVVRLCHRMLLFAGVSVGVTVATATAQISDLRGLPPEVLHFSFVAPPPPQATLKAWDGIVLPDQGFNLVLGPVGVDWNRKNLDWRFVWEANGAGVASVRWEISKYPFPAFGGFVPAPGVGLIGTASTQMFLVDLNLLAPRPPNWTPRLAVHGITGSFTSTGVLLPPTELTVTTQPTRLGALNIRFPGAMIPDTSSASVNAYAVQADPVIAQSMTLYARVVPLNSSGVAIGPPSNVVVFKFFEPDSTNVLPQPVFVHANAGLVDYTPVRPYNFNWGCHVVYTTDIDLVGIKKGDKANICEHDSDIVGDILEGFGDIFEFVVDFANWVSDTYSDIKAEVVTGMSDVLTTAGIPCNETCASIALNTAMVAAGMPPELPDVEQLKAMGEGYLVDAVANYAEAQGVPVPPQVREELRQQAAKMIDDAADNLFTGGDGGFSLYIPDVTYQFHGPIVVFDLTNPNDKYVSMNEALRIEDQTGRYKMETFSIPPLPPGHTVRIALTLDPVQDPKAWMDLLPTDGDSPFFAPFWEKMEAAENALQDWRTLYRTDNLVLKVIIGSSYSFNVTLPAQ